VKKTSVAEQFNHWCAFSVAYCYLLLFHINHA